MHTTNDSIELLAKQQQHQRQIRQHWHCSSLMQFCALSSMATKELPQMNNKHKHHQQDQSRRQKYQQIFAIACLLLYCKSITPQFCSATAQDFTTNSQSSLVWHHRRWPPGEKRRRPCFTSTMTDAAVHTITSDSDSDSFSFPSSSATTVSINNSNQPSRPCTPPKEIVPVPHPHSPTFENQNEHWKFACKIYEALK